MPDSDTLQAHATAAMGACARLESDVHDLLTEMDDHFVKTKLLASVSDIRESLIEIVVATIPWST